MAQEKQPLTLDDVKACVGFEKNSTEWRACIGMIDCWHKIALCSNKTEQGAIEYALDEYCKYMLKLSKLSMPVQAPNPDTITVGGVTLEVGDSIRCKYPAREGERLYRTYKVRSIERDEKPGDFFVRFDHPHWAEWDIEMCPSTVYNSEGVSILPSRHFATIAEIIKPSK